MKKIFLISTLLLSVLTFSQKDELKALKKIYSKSKYSASDIESFKSNLDLLAKIATEESDKVTLNYYKAMLPILDLKSKGDNVSVDEKLKLINEFSINNFVKYSKETLDYEVKTGKEVFTNEIKETLLWFKPTLGQFAFQLNGEGKFKEGSAIFYSLYNLDKNAGSNLENASILAVQSKDYVLAEKLYEEYSKSDYLENGVVYFAVNKANEVEEELPNLAVRTQFINLGTYEKPRDEKVALKKPTVFKMLGILKAENKKLEEAKEVYKIAKGLNPKDVELRINEANLYYLTKDFVTYEKLLGEVLTLEPENINVIVSLGYSHLSQEANIVQEINNSTDASQRDKYNKLILDRKNLYKKALPYFEKAYKLESTNADYKNILKSCYEVLEMSDKAKNLN